MSHSGIDIRPGARDDVGRLIPLLDQARYLPSGATPLGNLTPEVLSARLTAFIETAPGRVTLAAVGDEVIGVAIGHVQPPGLFSETAWLQLEVLLVVEQWRRHGCGRSLLADQARFAMLSAAPRIVTQPVSGVRSEARFLSRLGFTAVGARRSIETSVLIRRLEARDHPRAGIESLIARRRVMHPTTPLRGIVAVPGEETVQASGSRRQVRRAELMRRSASS